MITSLPTKRISAISHRKKTFIRVLPTRWRRKPASVEITSLSPYVLRTKRRYDKNTKREFTRLRVRIPASMLPTGCARYVVGSYFANCCLLTVVCRTQFDIICHSTNVLSKSHVTKTTRARLVDSEDTLRASYSC